MTPLTPSPSRTVPLALLVLIAFSGTLAMHIFVPALPAAAAALHTDTQTIQLSITVYILGLALGQLIYGPLSDATGRRPAVLIALCLYLLGGLASYFAASINLLIGARFLQALGGAGGLALTRVIVADTSKGNATTRSIAVLNLLLLLGPGFAPVVGAVIEGWLGWRSIFAALSLMGLFTFLLTLRFLPETGQPSHHIDRKAIFGNFKALFQNRAFTRCVSGAAFGSTACYAYFVSAPFILHSEMGLSTQMVGYCVGITLAAAATGTMITRSIVGRVPDRVILIGFASLGAMTGTTFLGLALAGLHTPATVIALSLLVLLSAGGMGPVAIGTALRLSGSNLGSAAGVFGASQMLSGVICSFAAGLWSDHSIGCGLVLCLGYLFCLFQFSRLDLR